MVDLKFSKEVADFLTSSPPVVIAISFFLLFFSLIPKLKHFIDFKEELKKQKISKLTEAYQSEFSSEPFKRFLEEEIEQELFYRTTGMWKTPKSEREKIISIVSQTELRITHFRRAQEYIKINNGILTVSLSNFTQILHRITVFFALTCAIFSMIYWLIPIILYIQNTVQNPQSTLQYTIAALLFLALGFFIFIQTLPVISAKQIQQKLINIQQ